MTRLADSSSNPNSSTKKQQLTDLRLEQCIAMYEGFGDL